MSEPGTFYTRSTHAKTGWDVLQVSIRTAAGHANSITIALDGEGKFRRKVDVFLDIWEDITDEADLKQFRAWYDDCDKAIAKQAAATLAKGTASGAGQ